jgi:hypothetical protein
MAKRSGCCTQDLTSACRPCCLLNLREKRLPAVRTAAAAAPVPVNQACDFRVNFASNK